MYREFDATIPSRVSQEQVEDLALTVFDILGEFPLKAEDYNCSSDIWFDGRTVVASCAGYVGYKFLDALVHVCMALGKSASRGFKATLSSQHNKGPEPRFAAFYRLSIAIQRC